MMELLQLSVRNRRPQTPLLASGATAGLSSSAERVSSVHCWASQQWHPGTSQQWHPGVRNTRSGLTLIEVVISTLLTGVVMVAALKSLGAASSASLDSSQRAKAIALATDLLNEIIGQAYLEPDGSPVFGHESGESVATRADFDDVDDYHNWNASPPQDKAGNTLSGGDDWQRTVRVVHADPDDTRIELTNADDQGVKRIRVLVKYKGAIVQRLFSIATSAWPPPNE